MKEPTPLFVKLTSVRIANAHDTIRPTDFLDRVKPGAMVAVRPCAPEHENRTFLGMYLCSAPTGVFAEQDGDGLVLRMGQHTNPAIYVPELDEIVWGYVSWWGELKDPDHLHQITDEDIQNVWYVRALKQLETAEVTP